MKTTGRVAALLAAAQAYIQGTAAQAAVPYTDAKTGITFSTWSSGANATAGTGATYTWGLALAPESKTTDANEYIGYLSCTTGWCGLSHGQSGQMTQALLLVAWPYQNEVLTSFRYATGYTLPGVYTGNATLTQISSTVNATNYELIYRCQGCFAWNQAGSTGNVSTSSGLLVIGRAQAKTAPTNPGCPDNISFGFHDNGFGQYGASLDGATNPSYSSWAALATKTVSTNCGATPPTSTATGTVTSTPATTLSTLTTTATSSPTAACSAAPTRTYDYIIAGAGAGGIPLADKLSEAGHSVLLIEKGPPSSGRWNGTMKPAWLDGTNLTRFDVPGLCNEIWVNSVGVACTDTDQMAGCVLGGGTAVNAGLWWKPYPGDWDYNFPAGWKSTDLAAATNRVFTRIPGTWHPSMDGQLYRQEGFNVIAGGLNSSGWTSVIPNDHPDQKNHTYGHTTFMFSNGERGGPMATYLVSAVARKNLVTLWENTIVRRAIRSGGHITGVELECNDGGYSGVVNVTAGTGRVIFSSGTFGTAKLLFRSGIGPSDQLQVVKSSTDGPTYIDQKYWINLPVGSNLIDHTNTDTIIAHPDVVFYDFYAAWDDPIASDKAAYLTNRTGILAMAAPNIGPMFWDQITGSDGIVRQLQWTSRVEGNDAINPSKNSMTMSQYLGRGVVSRGRMTISQSLDTVVSTAPYLHNDQDKAAVIQGLKNLQAALANVQNLTWIAPAPNQTAEDYVNNMIVSPSNRRANHWMGTSKLGTDDGRITNGTAVVDLNAKVYGTDNLFVVDASIFPGMSTGNPSAMIVIASEQAAARLLALPAPRPARYGAQCGGSKWTGSFQCESPYTCQIVNADTSVCQLPTIGKPLEPPTDDASSDE